MIKVKIKAFIFLVLMVASFGAFIFFAPATKAAEGDCHLDWCLVPAPTIYLPPYNSLTSARPNITGLTWKTTIVKVFLDGAELKNIQQIDHQDYYGSFWAQPDFDLAPGRHYVYTIAYSEKPSLYDQSKESLYIYFNVPQIVKKTKPVATAEPINKTVAEQDQQDDSVTAGLTENESSEISAELTPNDRVVVQAEKDNAVKVEVENGRIEGGVSVAGEGLPAELGGISDIAFTASEQQARQNNKSNLQQAATYEQIGEDLNLGSQGRQFSEKMKENRMIGLFLLAIILLAIGASVLIKRLNSAEGLVNQDDDFGEVPPPVSAIINDPFLWNVPETEVIGPEIASLDIKDLGAKDYWGEASSAAYVQPASSADQPIVAPTEQNKPIDPAFREKPG